MPPPDPGGIEAVAPGPRNAHRDAVRSAFKREEDMTTATSTIEALANREYKYGFVTEIETDAAPRGLNEDIIRLISAKKNEHEWMLEWRLKSYRHWAALEEANKRPEGGNIHYGPIDYQDLVYYSAPKPKGNPASPNEIDPELLATFQKLGIPLAERNRLAGVAVH